MKIQISGSRDGLPWPAIGGEITVPDAEGAELCAQGYATPVAAAPVAEKRPAAKRTERRA